MKMDQEIGIQTSNYAAPIAHVIDRDFDLLRAHARERSIWAARMQRVQDIVTTAMAIVLGTVMGWLLVR